MSLSTWRSGDALGDADPTFDVRCSLDKLEVREVPEFDPCWVGSVLYSEDLEIFHLKYHILIELMLEVASPRESIALLPRGWISLFKESFKVRLRLPFSFLVV